MFFYELPRLSVDLDFDILGKYDENIIEKIILSIKPILETF
jgi:hypothetical protein